MISQHHRTETGTASNDNGRFADVRRHEPVVGAGVIALAARRGSVTLNYVAEGVMIISRDAVA